MAKVVKLGIIGLGARAETLLATLNELRRSDIEVTAICDVRQERIDRILSILASRNAPKPETYTDYRPLIASDNVDAVLVPTSWNSTSKSPKKRWLTANMPVSKSAVLPVSMNCGIWSTPPNRPEYHA